MTGAKTEMFLAHFDAIAEAPSGVEMLRGLVLDLATQGRLVVQEPADEPAKMLLERIAAEKQQMIKGRLAKERGAPRPLDSGLPQLPPGWTWTQIRQLGFVNPRNSGDEDTPAGFVPMPRVPIDLRQSVSFEIRPWSEISRGYTHVADGDVALAKITPCFQNGKSAVFNGLPSAIGAATTELFVLRPTPQGVDPRYVLLFLKSPRFIEGGIPTMTGTAGQQRLPRDYFEETPFPLPPRAEQERIAEEVETLMGLCDALEQGLTNRAALQSAFAESAAHALAIQQTPRA